MFHVQLAAREHIRGGLVQQETKRAAIHTHAARFADIYKLDVLILIDLELEPLGHIVHFGRHNGIGTMTVKFRQHLQKGRPFRKTLGLLGVLAVYLYHEQKI